MRKLAALVLVVVLLGAACGDDDDDSTSTGGDNGDTAAAPVELEGEVNDEGSTDLGGDEELQLEADDFYFGPTFIKAEPGQRVKVEIGNEGDNSHTFTIDSPDVDVEVKAGEDSSVEVTLPQSGATRFYCRFHEGQGMQGAFYFKDGDKVGSTGGDSNNDAPAGGGIDY